MNGPPPTAPTFRYYHDIFLDQYATIWTLFPLLAILAISRNGRAALFCLVPFVVAFVAALARGVEGRAVSLFR